MNSNMTTLAKNPKIIKFIKIMTFIDMMDVKISSIGAYKAFILKKLECSSSIYSRSLSIVLVRHVRALIPIKINFLTSSRTEFRLSTFFTYEFCSAFLTRNFLLSIRMFTRFKKTFATAKSNSIVFTSRNIRRSFKEYYTAFFARNFNPFASRRFITFTRTVFRSVFTKRILTCGTGFHMSSIPLAIANVNKQNLEVPNE